MGGRAVFGPSRLNALLGINLKMGGYEMFGVLGDLTKAVVGVVVEMPIAIAADVVTMGGTLTDQDEPYTATALKSVMQNVENATKPDHDA